MAVTLQKLRNRFRPKVPVNIYASLFGDLESATIEAVWAHEDFWYDEDATEAEVIAKSEALAVALFRLDAARTELEKVRPANRELDKLHTDVVWVARGYAATINHTMNELAKVARGKRTGSGVLGGAMESALQGHKDRMLHHLDELSRRNPELHRVLGASEEYRAKVLEGGDSGG